MGNMAQAIRLQLAACNGGPGLTADELAARWGLAPAIMRTELAHMVFAKDGGVTCIADGPRSAGRYKLGDSASLRTVSS
jgi:hypothetical protein